MLDLSPASLAAFWGKAVRGSSCLRAALLRSAFGESALAAGAAAVHLLWDIAKFFERIVHELLVRRARRVGAPLRALRVYLAMYRTV